MAAAVGRMLLAIDYQRFDPQAYVQVEPEQLQPELPAMQVW